MHSMIKTRPLSLRNLEPRLVDEVEKKLRLKIWARCFDKFAHHVGFVIVKGSFLEKIPSS